MALVLLLSIQAGYGQFYNGSYQEFGQNRVQFNQIKWQSHDYERFKVYFNSGSTNYAVYVARSAQKNLMEIERKFDSPITGKIEFLVYNTQGHFKQSNIGLTGDQQNNIGGTTRFYNNKVFIYYEGDHKKLDQQIRAGIATVMFYQMMYGDTWREMLKNNALMNIPQWFSEGFISYVANPWDAEIENYVKDGILTGKFKKFNRLEGTDARFAGHAIWNYVAEVKGENQLPNVLYMARMSRNVENGFLYTLGYRLKELQIEYNNYYEKKFNADMANEEAVKLDKIEIKKPKRFNKRVFRQFKLSPDGMHAAFVTHEMGQYRVYVYNIAKKKLTRIDKGDYKLNRIPDFSFPVLCWHPLGDGLVYIMEKKGEVLMKVYNVDTRKKVIRPLGKVEKVTDFAYSPDGKLAVMSAVAQGQTDIYLFKPLGNSLEKLTDDLYDDIHPEFVNKGKSIIFSSNRPNDTLLKKIETKPFVTDYDVFVMDISGRRKTLTRITSTPFVNELQPSQYDTSAYTYLTDENGIFNRVVSTRDSAIAYVDTAMHYRYFLNTQTKSNYNRGVLEYDVNFRRDRFTLMMLESGKYVFYTGKLKADKAIDLGQIPQTRWRMNFDRMNALETQRQYKEKLTDTVSDNRIKIIEAPSQPKDSSKLDFNYYIFNNEKPSYEKEKVTINNSKNNTSSSKDSSKRNNDEIPFALPEQELYATNFATDMVVTQLDNNFLSQSYQRYNGDGSTYFTPGLNAMIKVGLSDVFENYKLMGGFRYSGNLTSNEYIVTYEDLSKRWDKKISVYRQSYLTGNAGRELVRQQLYDARYMLRFPFSEVLSLRSSLIYRFDRSNFLATDYAILSKKASNAHRGGAKLELVYDNTIPKGVNLFNGFRGKLFFEYYKDIFKDKTNMFVTGIDLRHYQKIHRCIIWANRLAASASFGDQQLVYFLGGVDNWITTSSRFDPTLQVSPDQNYAFMALATPMRGFLQNVRNGSNFAMYNSELRVPLFRYLVNRPMKSDFLETFQVVAMFDAGTAWTGWNPYSDKNSFNKTVISNPQSPIIIVLENQKEPIVYGYGWGLRARIFGYFLRFDYTWGIDDGFRLKPRKYFSLSLDF